ncbi:MAG: hypothetical protein ACXVXW_03635, partial [Mycobacteriaceae bacterium]
SGAGARLLGVSLAALSTSTQLALLPGEVTAESQPQPVVPHPSDGRTNPPVIGMRLGAHWFTGRDAEHTELGRGWVVRCVAADDSLSGQAELVVRFEEAHSRMARQRRFALDDPHLTPAGPAPVQSMQ